VSDAAARASRHAVPEAGSPNPAAPVLTQRELLLADAIAARVAALLQDESRRDGLVDAAALAVALGVRRDYVYRHARELGGRRLGGGNRGPLRFDLDRALASATSCSERKESQTQKTASTQGSRRGRRPSKGSKGAHLLPIRGPRTSLSDYEDTAS